MLAPTPTPIPEEEDQSAEDVSQEGELILAARVNDALWRGVKPSDERGMAIPMLFQGDYAQIVCTLGGRSLRTWARESSRTGAIIWCCAA